MRKVLKVILVAGPLFFMGCGDGLSSPTTEVITGGELFVNFPASAIKPGLIETGGADLVTVGVGYTF